jgi:hypothetical protein
MTRQALPKEAALTVEQMRAKAQEQADIARANATLGQQGWFELHPRALLVPTGTDDSAWLEAFGRRVPCGDCRTHWLEMLARTPPGWGLGFDYFAWTVARHNEVSLRIGRAEITLAAARAQWSRRVAAGKLSPVCLQGLSARA